MPWFRRRRGQPVVDERLGLTVSKDGRWVRATTAWGTQLLSSTDPAGFLRAIQAVAAKVDLVGGATEVGGRSVQFTAAEFDQLRLAIALHWARYCLSTGVVIDLHREDLEHPQTWDIVLKAAQDKYGAGTAEALALAAQMLGISVEQLTQWRSVEDERISHM